MSVRAETFRFALPPSTALETFSGEVRRLRKYFTNALGRPSDVTVSRSYEILTRNLLSGAVDAAWAPPFVCAQTEPRGVKVLVRTVRRGKSSYCSALVVRKEDEPATPGDLSSLRGKRAVWVDPHSVAGYLLPIAYLKGAGIEPATFFSDQAFAGSYPSALGTVLEGHADITAVHALQDDPGAKDEALRALSLTAPGSEAAFSVVALTDTTPSDGVVIGPRSREKGPALERALLAMKTVAPEILQDVFHGEAFEIAEDMAYRALYAVAPRTL